jgi:hypothetical protein
MRIMHFCRCNTLARIPKVPDLRIKRFAPVITILSIVLNTPVAGVMRCRNLAAIPGQQRRFIRVRNEWLVLSDPRQNFRER